MNRLKDTKRSRLLAAFDGTPEEIAAAMRRPPTCNSCKFSDGEVCRRYPPARIDKETTGWPVIRPQQDWCGEYKRKEKSS